MLYTLLVVSECSGHGSAQQSYELFEVGVCSWSAYSIGIMENHSEKQMGMKKMAGDWLTLLP